jgi:hypothetical protein
MYKKITIYFLLLSITNSCSLLSKSSINLYQNSIEENSVYDCVIIPGIPFNEPKWDKVMLMRVTWAVYLYQKGVVKNIIMSGSAVYTPYKESEIMKEYAIALGVPDKHIFIEDKAEHSTENLWYGYNLANSLGFYSIALASDPFQTKMLRKFAKKKELKIGYLPVIFNILKDLPHDTPLINYEKYKIKDFTPLPKREDFVKRFKGTLGKNIKNKKNG